MVRIAVFASGSGTNAENLIQYFRQSTIASVSLIVSNNADAGVVGRAKRLKVPHEIISKKDFLSGVTILKKLKEEKIDYIVLAGFLLLVPQLLLSDYKNKIINLHPALLPLHGGKGYFGSKVHESVIGLKSIISGITVHYVNEEFDEGEIIFQAACHVDSKETPDSLAKKIHDLEYAYFPVVIEKIISNYSEDSIT